MCLSMCLCIYVCVYVSVCVYVHVCACVSACSRVHVLSWWFEVIANALNINSSSGKQSLEDPLAPFTLIRSLLTSDLLTFTSRSTKEKEISSF